MDYTKKLMIQYADSIGIEKIDLKSKTFINEFYSWVNNQRKIYKPYIDLLNEIEADCFKETCAEIGKGKYDSVFLSKPVTLITPYVEDLNIFAMGKVINAKFEVHNDVPMIFDENMKKLIPVSANQINHFMVQNPYDMDCIKNWENLVKSKNVDITVGIFGNVNDKDFNKKILQLRTLRDQLSVICKENYNIVSEYYCYAFTTNVKKAKIKK